LLRARFKTGATNNLVMLKSIISISVIDAKGHIGVFGNKFQSISGLISFFSKVLQHFSLMITIAFLMEELPLLVRRKDSRNTNDNKRCLRDGQY